MKPPAKLDVLLDEVLDSAPAIGPAVDPLGSLLRAVRHRKRLRRVRRAALACLVCALVGWTCISFGPTRSAPASAVKATGPASYASGVVIASTQAGLVPVVGTESGQVWTVSTADFPRVWAEIDDRQLLALLQGRGGLVRHGPDMQELILLNPRDWQGFSPP